MSKLTIWCVLMDFSGSAAGKSGESGTGRVGRPEIPTLFPDSRGESAERTRRGGRFHVRHFVRTWSAGESAPYFGRRREYGQSGRCGLYFIVDVEEWYESSVFRKISRQFMFRKSKKNLSVWTFASLQSINQSIEEQLRSWLIDWLIDWSIDVIPLPLEVNPF